MKTRNLLRFWWDSEHSSVMKRLSRTQMYDWLTSFQEGWKEPRCMTDWRHLKKAEKNPGVWLAYVIWRRLNIGWKHAKTTLSAGKVTASGFWYSQGVLFVCFLIEQPTVNAAYYSKLLKVRIKPASRSNRRGRSVKSVCLLHDNARPHTAAVTIGTSEEMHWEVLPHLAYSPDLAACDFHLLGPLREVLVGKKIQRRWWSWNVFVQRWLEDQPQTFFERGIIELPEP
jgi:hypothetical protein